jgi:hypothetical protein
LLRGAMRITASVQSLAPSVLENIKRSNISLDAIMMLSDQTSDTDTHSYSEIILALPGDSLAIEEATIQGLMESGIGNITQHQLALIYGTELNSRATRDKYQMRSMFRPIQRCIGNYKFGGKEFKAIEIEEICVANSTMTFDDYVEARRLYLTVGMFYNDRIFGEIHALLRILGLRTFDWIKVLHGSIDSFPAEIKSLYDGFTDETKGELWADRNQLVRDVEDNIDRYIAGEVGGNMIYKYRSRATMYHFEKLHACAYAALRSFLADQGVSCELAVKDIESYSRRQKFDLLNTKAESVDSYSYDVHRLITDPGVARDGKTLEDLRYPSTVRIAHTPQQVATIERELNFYGRDIGGLTMLFSRFPVKRFYRKAIAADQYAPIADVHAAPVITPLQSANVAG